MSGMSGDIRLGGRLFNVINYDVITVVNESYIHALMRATGLDVPLTFKEGEDDLAYQLRMQARVIDTLRLPELLGGFLLPMGKTETDWTPALAKETAAYIEKLTDRADREEVFRLAFTMNVYFFREGLTSLGHFQNSSRKSTEASPPTKTAPPAVH